MSHKSKTPCKCGGINKIIKLEIDDVHQTILLCQSCHNQQTLTISYEEAIKQGLPILKAITVSMFGTAGDDKQDYMNVRNHKDFIFVFGDNLIGDGSAGQAKIRNHPNAFGIPTKRLPAMTEDSFFSDKEDEEKEVLSRLRKLYALSLKGNTVVFPSDGLGTGLAEMEKRSPKLFQKMNEIIYQFWGINFATTKGK